jgi:hypothetical protein
MTRTLPLLIAFVLAACGPAPEPKQPDTLPTPSGPPVAQQPAPQAAEPALSDAPQWETLVQGRTTSLRLAESSGTTLQMTCLRNPARLIVWATGFKVIESEDRFTLGLGDEPVTLVADLRKRDGVTADAPVPEKLRELLQEAKQISARYGNQQVGPVAAPQPPLVRTFTEACEKLGG